MENHESHRGCFSVFQAAAEGRTAGNAARSRCVKGKGNSGVQQESTTWDLIKPSRPRLPAGLEQRKVTEDHRESRCLVKKIDGSLSESDGSIMVFGSPVQTSSLPAELLLPSVRHLKTQGIRKPLAGSRQNVALSHGEV